MRFESFGRRITVSAVATALLALITLAPTPKTQLDFHLRLATQGFAWSAAFLAGGIFWSEGTLSTPVADTLLRWVYETLQMLWFVAGWSLWIFSAIEFLLHFGLTGGQAALVQLITAVPITVAAIAARRGAKK